MLSEENPPKEWFFMLRAGLTIREAQVLTFLLLGKPQKIIAMDLGLSPKTINTHKMLIMRKMNVAHDVALVLRAIELRMLKHPSHKGKCTKEHC